MTGESEDVHSPQRGRRRALHTVGDDPDPRFTLANERTFLAWNRTALALVGGGLAVSRVLPDLQLPGANALIGVPLTVLGAVVAFMSYFRWQTVERALRLGRPLPRARMPAVVGLAVGLLSVIAAVAVAVE